MKLNIPYKTLRVYQITPEELDNVKINEQDLDVMITPNFSEFNELLTRASTGLSTTKKKNGNLICFRRIGVIVKSSRFYCNISNAFDILQNGHLQLVDEDNTDGLELLTDFLDLKKELFNDYILKLIPLRDEIVKSLPKEITLAKCTKIKNIGYHIGQYNTDLQAIATGTCKFLDEFKMDHMRNPFIITVILNENKEKISLAIHPKKSSKGSDKTIMDTHLKNFYYMEKYSKTFFTNPCLTEIDLIDSLNQFISQYNEVIKKFNDGVEILKKKYLALYMLNSVGLKGSLI